MGQTISTVPDMLSYAGDLRRAAKQQPAPELGAKLQQSAAQLEKMALARAGLTAPGVGTLLDTFA
jgi:hypothetical protein